MTHHYHARHNKLAHHQSGFCDKFQASNDAQAVSSLSLAVTARPWFIPMTVNTPGSSYNETTGLRDPVTDSRQKTRTCCCWVIASQRKPTLSQGYRCSNHSNRHTLPHDCNQSSQTDGYQNAHTAEGTTSYQHMPYDLSIARHQQALCCNVMHCFSDWLHQWSYILQPATALQTSHLWLRLATDSDEAGCTCTYIDP